MGGGGGAGLKTECYSVAGEARSGCPGQFTVQLRVLEEIWPITKHLTISSQFEEKRARNTDAVTFIS